MAGSSSVENEEERMSIRLLVSMKALPGKGAEFAKVRAPRHAEVREEPGCEQFDLFQNTENPDQLILVEKWTDEASLAAHQERNRQRPLLGGELRDGPTVMERYEAE
jgi:quinol monooxygenase YgiN